MFEIILNVFPILHELNDNKIIKVYEKYTSLKTIEQKVEPWWDSLDLNQKMEIGSVALHYRKMSPNYKWNKKIL